MSAFKSIYRIEQATLTTYRLDRAKWRDDLLVEMPNTLDQYDGEDALDQECLSFEDVEDRISHSIWTQRTVCEWDDHAEEFLDFDPMDNITPIGVIQDADLELAREGRLVGSYLERRLD